MPVLTDPKVRSRLEPQLVQCPLPQILLALKDVLADFYDRTRLDRRDLEVDVVALSPTATLPIPAGMVFVQAHEMRLNKQQLIEKSEDSLDLDWSDLRNGFNFTSGVATHFSGLDDPTWRLATGAQPRAYYFEPNGDVRLVAIPEGAFTGDINLKARVSLKPDADAVTSVDDAHWRDNKDTFVAGTLARLMVMAEKPWTNLKMSMFWGEQYESGVDDCFAEVNRSQIRTDRQTYRAKAYS